MTTYTITIDTQRKEDGITAARGVFNTDNAWKEFDITYQDEVYYYATNAEYMQFVMDRAAQSYADNLLDPEA